MWQKPGGHAMRFSASQSYAVHRIAFSWQACFPVLGPIGMKVVDEYADGGGRLEARILGLPVQRQRGAETVAGEALRYLAELPWVPYAMAENRELDWRELDDRSVEVASDVGGRRLAVSLEFDGAGDIVRASSEMRLLEVEKKWVPTPWGGDFRDYDLVGGMRMPTSADVYWELTEGRFVYWRGRVTAAAALHQPFERQAS